MLKCVKNWVENNREKHNSNVRTHKKNKYKWNSITNDFRKILLQENITLGKNQK